MLRGGICTVTVHKSPLCPLLHILRTGSFICLLNKLFPMHPQSVHILFSRNEGLSAVFVVVFSRLPALFGGKSIPNAAGENK